MFFNFGKEAKAYIKGGKDNPSINGFVTFKETINGVLLTAKIRGLPESKDNCYRKILWISYS